jgi:quercetin dioxygenase-like cupin family protein
MKFTLNIFTLLIVCALNALPLLAQAQTTTKDFVTVKREQIVWKDGDLGVKSTVLFGDPTKPGIYVVRNIFPAGIMSTPHSHDQDRYVTVIRGTWNAGTGPSWDPASTDPLPTGSVMFHPANAVHFDGSIKEETEVQIMGMGPVGTKWVHPELGRFGKPRKMN